MGKIGSKDRLPGEAGNLCHTCMRVPISVTKQCSECLGHLGRSAAATIRTTVDHHLMAKAKRVLRAVIVDLRRLGLDEPKPWVELLARKSNRKGRCYGPDEDSAIRVVSMRATGVELP